MQCLRAAVRRSASYFSSSAQEEKELAAIFARTYGAVDPSHFYPQQKRAPVRPAETGSETSPALTVDKKDYLLVDGYNIIFAWDELKALAARDLHAAREALIHILSNYQGVKKCELILVFDAYKVRGGMRSIERIHNISVVYTKEAETADMYIEKVTYEVGKKHRVKVATSDALEQMIILGHGAGSPFGKRLKMGRRTGKRANSGFSRASKEIETKGRLSRMGKTPFDTSFLDIMRF